MNKFYVIKEANTFSDTLECAGLASFLYKLSHLLCDDDRLDIHVKDKYGYFELTSDYDFNIEKLKNVDYFELIPFIANKNDNLVQINHTFIDYEKLKEQRSRFFKLKSDEQKKSDLVPPPNYDIIRQFANLNGYRTAFQNLYEIRSLFSKFVIQIIKYYNSQTSERIEIEKELNNLIKNKIYK